MSTTSLIVTFIGWVVVIVGWFVAHYFTLQREWKAEWRRTAHSLAEKIEDIEALAIEYHKTPDRHIEHEEEIIKRLERAESKILMLNEHLDSIARDAIRPLRQAITLKNFQTHGHQALSGYDPQLKLITLATNTLLRMLYTAR